MADVSTVSTKETSPNTSSVPAWWKVDDLSTVQRLLPHITHDDWLHAYVIGMFRDPNTLILQSGRSCIVASIIDHPYVNKICFLVWAQNPEGFPPRHGLSIVERWAKDRGCEALASLIGETDKPLQKAKAYRRLTGLRPYRMVMLKEI